jgi:imidazolonepropionase-like amidohydrolase
MRDLVKQAHKEGIPVLMHATSFDAQKFGLAAGIDIFAHTMWNWHKNPEQFLDTIFTQEHKDVLKEIATGKIGYQPTFRTIYGEVDLMEGDFISDPALADVYPEAYLNWLNTEEGNWGKQKIINRAKIVKAVNPTLYNFLRPPFETDEAMFRAIQEVLKIRMNTVAKFLSDHDAKLLFGTDGVAMNMATNPPGYNGFLEMQHWNEAGIPLEKIFIAATYNNANAFHLDDKYGTIEKGKIANLVLLNEDPLQSISAYNHIHTVIVRGNAYSRNTLSANTNQSH